MAVPRVFISSTFYDLVQVRYNIGDFIKNLGYEPVMHEKSAITYTQNTELENDCYNELSSCDIVVCIIGNNFGTQSQVSELSITMEELKTAIKSKKKIYVFIAKDVFIENRTYEQNKDNGSFKSAYTDDLKIHEFILNLKKERKIVISSFETTDEITNTLKLQFAGLFQSFLQEKARVTNEKITYDLAETAENIKSLINEMVEHNQAFISHFDGSAFAVNMTLQYIRKKLGLEKVSIYAKNLDALDEFMKFLGFESVDVDDFIDDERKYVRNEFDKKSTLILKSCLLDEENNFKDIRNKEILDNSVIWIETSVEDDLPF
ncbi:MAG: DUF4062 domain-containing protein [Ruminococcaceae bacterium]|nr:DUF4062 domain-containing protein [Oscillospiraceae bacterium]